VVLNLGSRDPLGVPNANLGGPKRKSGISTNFPQYFCFALDTSCFCVHITHPILFSQPFQFRLLFLPFLSSKFFFSFHASVARVYYTLFRSAYFCNFDLGVPDDIGRVQGIPAVKKVKNHWYTTFSNANIPAASICNSTTSNEELYTKGGLKKSTPRRDTEQTEKHQITRFSVSGIRRTI